MSWKKVRRQLDEEIFLPSLDKHHSGGMRSTSFFDLSGVFESSQDLSDGLEGGALALDEEDRDRGEEDE